MDSFFEVFAHICVPTNREVGVVEIMTLFGNIWTDKYYYHKKCHWSTKPW
jgi:hypothetical protein